MSVSSRLTRKLHQVLGEEAKELLGLMQQEDSHRGELREILVRMEGQLTAMDGRLTAMDGRLTAMDGRLTTMDGRLTTMEGRFTGIEIKIAGVETLVERRSADLIKWSFVFWVGAVAAIAMLAGVLQ